MKAKKSLGQNFLKSVLALNKIIEVGEIKKGEYILEIGPGKGILTEKLLSKAEQVVAVEKDRELFEFLQTKFSFEIKKGSLTLLNEDILDFDPTRYFKGKPYKIIANIPYNITGAILKKFLTAPQQPISMVLMVQHEVAKRIMATDKKESILSISVKAYGSPKLVMKVHARYFSPSPKVDSAIISVNNISKKLFSENALNEGEFWETVRAGFAHKRKKLSSNLKSIEKYKKNTKIETLANKRAENMSLSEWIHLLG